jgi:indole-3-glycerol phosphate synthase
MNILETIVERKREEIRLLPVAPVTVDELKALMARRGDRRDFTAALKAPGKAPVALIAEVKKASPSAGVIRADFDPVKIAKSYESSGAHCLSVLTDRDFFQGSIEFLRSIRREVKLPLLRKDFIIDPRQIREAIEWGADAILLIVAILTDEQLRFYLHLATAAGLAVLVETHDESEMDRAVQAGAQLIGVNNRNLKTFKVDIATTERLALRLKQCSQNKNVLLVSESGIHTHADVERLARCGSSAILVGESLMRHDNIAQKVAELLFATGAN